MAGEQLRVTEGEERGKLLRVAADLLIGREAPDEAGKLGLDPELSRRHAHVSRAADGRLTIEDLGSANGTLVNDKRLDAPRTLDVGDVIRVGRTVLEVTEGAGAGPERSRPQAKAPATRPAVVSAEALGEMGAEPGEVLVVTAGSVLGRRLTLTDELVIGREASGEGKLGDDPELSRRHARVARNASGQLTIEDLGSANGTFVNGERVRGRQVLELGDSVRVGSTTLQLNDAGGIAATGPAATPPAPPARRRPAAPIPSADRDRHALDLPLGSVFAGCRVEELIGYGDMGVVYRAEELALQRRVALKLILPEFSREERFRERFRRESRVAAAIDHPNVIPVFDAGDEDGVLFIMMRFVQGTDLGDPIATEGRIEPLRAARIVGQVGAALDAAHARGLLHRDVKPSNVLLGREEHVYLSDFGLAKPAASTAGLTRQGSIVARIEYVAPEQILNQRVDARADVYALGCLLFEALTGEPPFARSEEGPGALAHLDAPRPSPTDLRPDLPRGFDEVVHRAMAKDPSERYPSAGDLGQAALVAAGGLRRASQWSVVARGEAAPVPDEQVAERPAAAPRAPVPEGARTRRPDVLRWAIPLAGLVIVFVGMLAALSGISSL